MKRMLIVPMVLLLAGLLAFGVACHKSSDQGKSQANKKGDPELTKLRNKKINATRFLNKQAALLTRLSKRLEKSHQRFENITGSMNQDNLTAEDFEVVQQHRQQVKSQKQELKTVTDLLNKFKEVKKHHQETIKKDAKASADQKKQSFTAMGRELETMKKDFVDAKKKMREANLLLKKMLSRYADSEEEKKTPKKAKIAGNAKNKAKATGHAKKKVKQVSGKKGFTFKSANDPTE